MVRFIYHQMIGPIYQIRKLNLSISKFSYYNIKSYDKRTNEQEVTQRNHVRNTEMQVNKLGICTFSAAHDVEGKQLWNKFHIMTCSSCSRSCNDESCFLSVQLVQCVECGNQAKHQHRRSASANSCCAHDDVDHDCQLIWAIVSSGTSSWPK